MKKENEPAQNYLDRVPVRKESIAWSVGNDGLVTLEVENKGLFNRIAQKLFKRPTISYIHLDENGSFIWQQIDGESDITEISKKVDGHFGGKAHPLYERLAKFFQILDNCNFIVWKE